MRTAATQVPIKLEGVTVHPGDILVGDSTGVVRMPKDRLLEVFALAEKAEATDRVVFEHVRKGSFIATFLGYVGEYWHVSIATDLPNQGRFARAKTRDKKGRKIPPPTVEKYLRPELITEVTPHGVD